SMRRPLFPSSANVRTISMPRRSAYSLILSPWFSVEYCLCSVDMRTYWAARSTCVTVDDSTGCIDPAVFLGAPGPAAPHGGVWSFGDSSPLKNDVIAALAD